MTIGPVKDESLEDPPFRSGIFQRRTFHRPNRHRSSIIGHLGRGGNMKRYVWILALLLSAAPAFAQDPEEALRELGMGGVFANGDLALRDIDTSTDPVQQLKRFFLEAKLPLNNDQVRRLDVIIEAQRKAMHGTNP